MMRRCLDTDAALAAAGGAHHRRDATDATDATDAGPRVTDHTQTPAISHRLGHLVAQAPFGIACIGLDGRWLQANLAACRILGRECHQLVHRPFAECLGHEDGELCAAIFAAVARGEDLHAPLEVRCRHASQHVTWLSLVPSLVRDAQGQAESLVVLIEDIERRKRSEHAHLEREFRLNAIVDNSPSALSLKTVDGRYALANPNLQRIHGRNEDAILGLNDFDLYPDEIARSFRAHDALVIETRERHSIEELVPVHGELRTYMSHMFPIFGEQQELRYVCRISLDITEKKRAETAVEFLAFHDQLTSLANRHLLHNRLEQALARASRSRQKGAVLLLDLDNFKLINDTLGHAAGDQLLIQVSERLGHSLRQSDTVARLGGDEFVVLVEELDQDILAAAEHTRQIGDKLRERLRVPFRIDGLEHRISCSMGAVMFGNGEQGVDELLRQADVAMYQAKKEGRDALRFFDQAIQDLITARAALENELHDALRLGQLRLHGQLQVDAQRRPLGVEMLVRWQHPARGLLYPGQFVPMAEESELIARIGRWVLESTCARLSAWKGEPALAGLVASVNVSARELRRPDFVSHLLDCVRAHGIDPSVLTLEITETSLLADIDSAGGKLRAIDAAGIRIALDDFGTGYSSLAHLKKLPISQLKIDQNFVQDMVDGDSDLAIVRAIIAMALHLDKEVIAEGVETPEQLVMLLELGCRLFQGYLFARPLPLEQLERQLRCG